MPFITDDEHSIYVKTVPGPHSLQIKVVFKVTKWRIRIGREGGESGQVTTDNSAATIHPTNIIKLNVLSEEGTLSLAQTQVETEIKTSREERVT